MSAPERSTPPLGLRERILASSLAARPAGRATPVPEPVDAVEALRRAATALDTLLGDLDDAEWGRPALRDLDVQGLIGHLIGVEDDVVRALSGDPAVAHLDHVADTQPLADRQRGRSGERTRRDWAAAVARTFEAAAGADPRSVVAVHGVRLPAAALCVARTFELWTHENDVRRATGRPATDPDAATLTLMTELAVGLLPGAVARTATPSNAVLRLVLTGPGGGTWQLSLGTGTEPKASPVRIGIVADAASFCRVVADRLPPADLQRHVTGDDAVALAVLDAAGTLALD
jgi:uncharacterized protein (TIGR03083 family)